MTPEITFDVEPIPDELKERDQWLLWDARNDRPRQPHWRGDFSISWSDPADWHSFEEAVQAARERESWGIGYVTAAENDDHLRGIYTVLDLDGCLEERGQPKDWLPSLQPFIDAGAYMEYSPSGTGIHIPLAGFEPPEWWTDRHFTGDEHEGVEALANKFCTFTGDAVESAGNSVEVSPEITEEFLAQASEAMTGEDPRTHARERTRSTPTESPSREDPLDSEAIEEALNHINPDVSYPTWRNIGFALQDHFSDRVALSLFKSWSRRGTKWDDEAERQAERIIQDATSGGGCTIGTVIHRAKQGGWEPPGTSNWTDRDFSAAVREETDEETELSDADVWEIWSAERVDGRLDEHNYIPEAALRHLAQEHSLYDFAALDDVDELPPKAYNRALWHVENNWSVEQLGADEDAAANRYKDVEESVFSWEDVRYIYEQEGKEAGRYAAVRLLRQHNHFLTPRDTEKLHIYNDDLGVFEIGAVYEVGQTLDRELGKHYSQHERREIVGRLKERTAERDTLEAAEFDDTLVCVKNGVLNIDRREHGQHELLEHDPKYKFTTYLPVEYDPTAECPAIQEFLDDITGREADKRSLLELVGNCLLPNYKHEHILFLFGEGANGKSTWLNVVDTFLGSDNTTSLDLQKLSENRFATARLVGKWANLAKDLPAKKLHDTGTLKNLSGDEAVSAEKKGQDGFDFHNRAKLMFAANRPPVLGERTYAIQRRLVPIHLPYKFTDADDGHKDRQNDLEADLTTAEELSGLLNAALDGLHRLEQQGDVSLPETKEERLELYEKHSDHIKAFRVDCLSNEGDEAETKADIYNAYTNFCEDRDREPVARSTFWKQLRKTTLNVTEKRVSKGHELSDGESRPRILDNVTFKERGLEYAPGRAPDSQEEQDRSDESDATSEPEPVLGAMDPGYGKEFTATVTTISDGEYSREAQGRLKCPHGTYIGFVVPGGNTNPVEGYEGKTFHFEDVTLRTDDDGLLQAVLNEAITIGPASLTPGGSGGKPDEAATDGGSEMVPKTDGVEPESDRAVTDRTDEPDVPPDALGSRADTVRLVEVLNRTGPVNEPELIAKADMAPPDAQKALAKALERGDIIEAPDGTLTTG
jgi:putative DNA primase/helicase